jgi:hypothetical protein
MYVADFETTTNAQDCRVWAWGLYEIGSYGHFQYGNSIDSFMDKMKELSAEKATVYFHNLKFDGEFIIYWMFTHGWLHVQEKKDRTNCSFMTLISDKGAFYSMEIYFRMLKTRQYKIKFLDSLKVLPLPVAEIARAFDLPIQKEEIEYDADRPVGHELTLAEISYLRNDCEIVARALEQLFKQELTKMTTAANAMNNYKEIISRKNFSYWYPEPDYDADVRQSYRGGFTYADPRFTNREIGAGIVLDVNSLYPSVMYSKPLPYGDPIYFTGQYKQDNLFQLYVQMIRCNFRLKKDHIPTIQIKQSAAFMPTEYLTDSNGEDVTMCLTSVDLALFFEHYDVFNLEFLSGWKWKASTMLFTDYIDKWYGVKQQATEDGNKPLRTIAKLMLNSLYGKFGMNPKTRSKIPVYDRHSDSVRYVYGEWEDRKPVYIPMATFITAWARYTTITAAQSVYDRFLYADTDSLHLIGTEIPEEIDVDPVRLGAWKHEATFTRAKYLRAKSYIEEIDGKLEVTCAGLPDDCHDQVTFENFSENAIYTGKLRPVHTSGGIVLEETNFSIRKGR